MVAVQPSVVTRTRPEYNRSRVPAVMITESEEQEHSDFDTTPTKLSSFLIRHLRIMLIIVRF